MKKLIALISAVLVIASLTACTSTPANNAATSSAPANNTASSTPAAKAADWKDLLYEDGKLTVGMCNDYPPYESLDAAGKLVGFDVDMAQKLADAMGLKLVIKQFGFQEVISATQLGEVDIGISAFGYKADRDVLFSNPYITSKQVIVVRDSSGITDLKGLSGKKIAAGTGTTCEAAAKKAVPDAKYSSPGDYTQMFAALDNGAVDAVACADTVAKNFVNANKHLVILNTVLSEEGTYIIAKKGNNLLMDAVNKGLAVVMSDSSFNKLLAQWKIGAE